MSFCSRKLLYGFKYVFNKPLWLITKTIQVRRIRHAGHCWRSRDELISDVLLWTPTHGRAKAGRPARTYIQQLCEDTGCCPEDLPESMNDKEKWRERVRDIRATSTTWWWWWQFRIFVLLGGLPYQGPYQGSRINHSWGENSLINTFLLWGIQTTSNTIWTRVAVTISSYYHIYPTPPLGQDMTQGQFLSGGFNSEFSFS